MADETGLKWWIRYVVVPLVGGGGIIGIILSQMGHLPNSSSVTSSGGTDTTQTRRSSSTDSPKKPLITCTFVATRLKDVEVLDVILLNNNQALKFGVPQGESEAQQTLDLQAGTDYTARLELDAIFPEKPGEPHTPTKAFRATVPLRPSAPCKYYIHLDEDMQLTLRNAN